MRNSKKTIVLKLKLKPVWALGKGHSSHMSGSGQHDNRPKRMRTRNAEKRRFIGEYD